MSSVNSNVLRLAHFLFLFFSRRLLSHGSMRTKSARAVIFGGIAAAYAGFAVLTYIVVRGMAINSRTVLLIAQSISLTLGLWVLLFFIVIRVLFMKADKLIELTHTFPVTNRQRILAYTLFEAVTVLVCVALVSGPLSASIAIRGGMIALPEILLGIVGQTTLLFLLLDIFYLALERALQFVGASRWRGFLLPCAFSVLLFAAYRYSQEESVRFLNAFYDGAVHYGPSRFFMLLLDRFGPFVAVMALLGSIALAVMTILVITPNEHARWSYFLKIPLGRSADLAQLHLRAVARSGEFLFALFIVTAASIAVLFIPGGHPPYWLAFLSLQAVYAVSSTEPIRKTHRFPSARFGSTGCSQRPTPRSRSSSSPPLFVLYAMKGVAPAELVKTAALCVFALIAALTISILFPAERHNPFSVLLGLCAALGLVGLVSFSILVWGIPEGLSYVLWSAIGVACMIYSVMGIIDTQKREYYAAL